MRRIEFVWLCLCLLGTQTALSASANNTGTEKIHGERLSASDYGPSSVETLKDVLARDIASPPQWLADPKARDGRPGTWVIPGRRGTTAPRSGAHHATNKWGDTEMGIRFPEPVDVQGAYFAGQGAPGAWTPGVRAIGYREGAETERTDWFEGVGAEAEWFEMNLCGVDRIVIQAEPAVNGAGWYAMDDFTFTYVRDTGLGPVVLDFEDLTYKVSLTGSNYAGLLWESGTGDFEQQAIHHPAVPPGMKVDEPEVAPEVMPGPRSGGTLPELVMDFKGPERGDAGSWSYPPDTDGAVGLDHYVVTVNRVFAVYDKVTGDRVVNVSLGSFLPGSSGDPRVLFDQHSGRWIVVASDFSSRIYLAVSLTSDPTLGWFKTSFAAETGKWPDYPTLGVDANGIYVAAYMVGGSHGMTIFAIDKAPLISGSPYLGTVSAFRNLPWEGAIQPAHTYGVPSGEYLVSRMSYYALRIRRIDPPLTDPTLTEMGSATVTAHNSPPDAPALGSNVSLDTVGTRPMMAVYRDGSLWTAHTVRVDNRAACRWYEINPETPEVIQSGTVSDSSLYFYFPSIMVNQDGDAVMAFTGSDPDQYASAYYTGRSAADPPGVMAPPVMYRAGTAPQNNVDSYGRNRWGDYSYTTLDPIDERGFWTIQEYAEDNNIWGTWVAVLMVGDCNHNGSPDAEDIASGTSQDLNGNGVPDECEVVPPESAGGFNTNRYVAFNPQNEGISVAFQVEMTAGPGSAGIVGWIDEPVEYGCPDQCSGEFVSGVVDAPVFRVWPEDLVYVGDCVIVPAASYALRASGDGVMLSDPLEVATVGQPTPKYWADVAGEKIWIYWMAPDGAVNMDDIMAAVQRFQQLEDAPHWTWVDVDGEDPNQVVNMTDVLQIIRAFQGEPYPFRNPAECP